MDTFAINSSFETYVQDKFRVLIVLSASKLHATVRMFILVRPFLVVAATLPCFLESYWRLRGGNPSVRVEPWCYNYEHNNRVVIVKAIKLNDFSAFIFHMRNFSCRDSEN